MVKSIQNILIPINFSKSSECAISTGISMCKRHNAALHLLQVKKKGLSLYPSGNHSNSLELALKEEVANQNRLEAQAKKIQRENNIDCFFHTSDGEFHNSVGTIAEDFYCDLIILEKSSPARLLSYFTGNNAYKIVKHAKCPVLTIPAEKRQLNFKKILLPLLPNSSGIEKLEIALPIIEKNKSKIVLFAPRQTDPELAVPGSIHDFINSADHLMAGQVVKLEKELALTDNTAVGILHKALEKKSDLIIITASVTDGLRSLFSGNYAERLMNNSSVPVLSVKLG